MNEALPLLQTRDLTKIYPGVIANEGIDLKLQAGRIHAIIGENGAGKSTLVSALYGATRPDRGELIWNGEVIDAGQPQQFRERGISFVPQHVTLIEPFTVWENIALSERANVFKNPLQMGVLKERALTLIETFELNIDLERTISDLPLGTRQNVELLKALLSSPKLLILDEPTAILTPDEVSRLFGLLRKLRDKGTAIVLIAHKLTEILELSDEITVLRSGRKVAHRDRHSTNAQELAALMTGDSTLDPQSTRKPPPIPEKDAKQRPLVWLEEVSLNPKSPGGPSPLKNVTMKVYAGEIFGIAGIDGNGQQQLFELLTGERYPDRGMFEVLDHDELPRLSVPERNALGLKRVSEDRHHDGLALDLPILDNLMLQYAETEPFSKKGWLRRSQWKSSGEALKKRFSIAATRLSHTARTLSGGNQQKVVLARELRLPAKLLVVSQPTRGLDFNASHFVEDQLRASAAEGAAVVLISGDLDELLALSHYIGILHRGQWMGTVANGRNAREQVGRLMAGHGSGRKESFR